MVYKCKICGGSLSVDSKTRIATCEYCGTQQVLPQFSDDSGRILYERGNHYLSVSEYDKAESIFNQLLAINPNDPEFYWDLMLCKYGVTFVCDPQSGKYIPTCNRTHFSSILHDENFQKALQLSTPDKAALYQQNADTIDEIQKGILALSRKEKPFDIFISYKETDANGNRSRDSVKAQDLYEKLTSEGYKVFFSRITLEDKIGTQYEPYIYAALSSSKVMLTICSSKENIESAWVKNEWSRFLTLRQSDTSKTLIPLYYDMQKSDLPEEFAILSAQDMQKEDFEQELIRGIKKLIPLPIMLAAKRKKQRKTIGIAAAVLCGVLLIGAAISFPFLKPYLENNAAYREAMALYDSGNYLDAAAAFDEISDFKDASDMKEKSLKTDTYNAAMQLYYDGNYPEATWAFRDMDGFNDSAEMQKKCESAWRNSLATIATEEPDPYGGAYYVTANGTVDTFSSNSGIAHQNIDIATHGKIVSIGAANPLYALHEDGYITNAIENNHLTDDAEWHDIVKISGICNSTNIVLRADGKMLYGGTDDEVERSLWLEPLNSWTNIIDFACQINYAYDFAESGIIIGIKSDGTLCTAYTTAEGLSIEKPRITQKEIESIIAQFNDVVKLDVVFDGISDLCIVALTKDGKIQQYINNEFSEKTADNISDISLTYWYGISSITLKKTGELVREDKVLLTDVVYAKGGYYVTRSGSIYVDNSGLADTGAKTRILDQWMEQ